MNAKSLLIVTAAVELGAGIALLSVPSWTAELLLGAELSSPPAFVVARIAGAALVSIAIACWLSRNGERREQSALVAGVLAYNLAVPIVLIQYWHATSLQGFGLWPACILHAGLAIWCLVIWIRS